MFSMTQQPADDHRHWTEADIPDLSGRTAVVTGANTGLGLQAARVLAERGAHVVLACRNTAKAGRAADQIAAASAGAGTSVVRLDLASQSSVRSAAEEIRARFPRLDLLINNAGVMEVPYQRTEDGFELTLATNHLGPFALTGLLLDRLAAGARIVTVSSIGHLDGVIDFDDLQSERSYDPGPGVRPVQAGEPPVHLRTGPPPAGRRRAGGRARVPSRGRVHGLVREPLQAAAVPAQPVHAVHQLLGGAERPDGRAAGAARGDRPVRAAAASTSARAGTVCAAGSTPATRRWWSRAPSPTTRPTRPGSGRSRRS